MMKNHKLPSSAYRLGESGRMLMLDIIICLAFINMISVFYYGLRAFLLTAVSVAACVVSESVGCLIMKRKGTVSDLSAIVTGMMLAALCPASAPLWLPVIGGMFAILVAKLPFGGMGCSIFNPAAAGWLFAALAFPTIMFSYPDPALILSAGADTPLSDLSLNITPGISMLELIMGNFPGPMGATPVLVMIACAVYLVVRRTASPATMLSFVGTCALFAFIFPRLVSRTDSALFELTSGCLLFAAVFMATDPSTSPKTSSGRILYGVCCGIITMLIRYFGAAFEEGAIAAILIMNCFSRTIDGFFLDYDFKKLFMGRKEAATDEKEY